MEPLGDEQGLRQGSSVLIEEALGSLLDFPPREESVASLTGREPNLIMWHPDLGPWAFRTVRK